MSRPYPAWNPAEDAFVCTAIRQVTPDIATVLLAPPRPASIGFDAGQYVTAEFDIDGTAVNRCYTIASPPTRPERLAFTIKREAAGTVSSWVHGGGLKIGAVVRVGAPQGSFTMTAHPAARYLLLTAGAGITPALSMLREAYDLGVEADIVLVHSQRRPADVAYRDELAMLERQVPGLAISFVYSMAQDQRPSARLDASLLRELTPEAGEREVLVCGPDSYRAAAIEAAVAAGCQAERVHQESFTFTAAAEAVPAPTGADGVFRVEFRDHGRVIDCPAGSTVLAAAAAAGLDLPSSCTQGICGTCKSTLISGQVDMQHGGGIRPREIASGRVLVCCSRPLSDLVVSS
jgi:ferredoxin-NADP reductase